MFYLFIIMLFKFNYIINHYKHLILILLYHFSFLFIIHFLQNYYLYNLMFNMDQNQYSLLNLISLYHDIIILILFIFIYHLLIIYIKFNLYMNHYYIKNQEHEL